MYVFIQLLGGQPCSRHKRIEKNPSEQRKGSGGQWNVPEDGVKKSFMTHVVVKSVGFEVQRPQLQLFITGASHLP